MRPEIERQILKECPNLYADRFGNMRSTAMCWGFETGDGWDEILLTLSRQLETEIIKLKNKTPKDVWEEYKKIGYIPKASQVKEKFGTLRFYMTCSTEEMNWYIEEACVKSYITCEQCSNKGKTRNLSWVQTLCDKCYLNHLANDIKYRVSTYLIPIEEEGYGGKKYTKLVLDPNKKDKFYKDFTWYLGGIVSDLEDEPEEKWTPSLYFPRIHKLYWWENKYRKLKTSIRKTIWRLKRKSYEKF